MIVENDLFLAKVLDIDATWLLSLLYLLMRIITSFLRYAGYLNFISRFVANYSSFTTTELSIILTFFRTAIQTC